MGHVHASLSLASNSSCSDVDVSGIAAAPKGGLSKNANKSFDIASGCNRFVSLHMGVICRA